jgi:hypothetical protein
VAFDPLAESVQSVVPVPAADVAIAGALTATGVVSFVQPQYSTWVIQLAAPGQRTVQLPISHVRIA